MTNVPWLDRAKADDPFGPMFQSVSELTSRIKRTLETDFAEVALKAEVSNVARPRSGHVYFTLKDDSASIRAVLWKSDAQRLAFDLTDGLAVRALGRLTVYAPRGEYQITIKEIEPEGIGALELAFRQRYAKLGAGRFVRAGSEAALAALSAPDRDRDQSHRGGGQRPAPGHGPSLALRRVPDRPDARSGSGRGPRGRSRARAGQPGRGRQRHRDRPWRR